MTVRYKKKPTVWWAFCLVVSIHDIAFVIHRGDVMG